MGLEMLNFDSVSVTLSARSGLFRIKRKQVLKEVTLTVHQGERVGVIGRNGAGKSTILRVAAGLLRPDSGSVHTPDAARVMLLSLMMGFDQRLSGRMNALMAAIFLNASLADARAAMPRIEEFSELGDYIDTPLHAYSSGMKARLSFAVSQVMEADVLLIDEMLGVGDEGFRKKSMEALRGRLCKNQTVLLVSHNLVLIQELCQRVVWVHEGRIRGDGDAAQVIAEYRALSGTGAGFNAAGPGD